MGMWRLSVDGHDGSWWRTLCVAPREACLERASDHDGGTLLFAPTSAPVVLRAEGRRGIYFMCRASSGEKPTMEPGPLRHPY